MFNKTNNIIMIPKDKKFEIKEISNTYKIITVVILIAIFVLCSVIILNIADLKPYDIETITIAELMSIDGIGQVRANIIYDYIQTHEINSFKELEQLNDIGDKTIQKLTENVKIP